MDTVTSPIHRLLVDNAGHVPAGWIKPNGLPSRLARQETFWACALELVAAGLLDCPLPSHVSVGKEGVALEVAPATWRAIEADLGWNNASGRAVALDVLRGHLMTPPQNRPVRDSTAGKLAELLPQRLLALVLLTALLEHLGRREPPRSFGYEFRELTQVARDDLAWAVVGTFDEAKLARQLFEYAGSRITRTDRLLQAPYYAYWRPLLRRMPPIQDKDATVAVQPAGSTLSPDFLLRGLKCSVQGGTEDLRAAIPEMPGPYRRDAESLLAELNRLRAENDTLRGASAAPLLHQLLTPLLTLTGDPVSALEEAANISPGLAGDLALAMRTLLLAREVEFIGEPGIPIHLSLPCSEYRLEGAGVGVSHALSRATFTVGRRGIRLRGLVIAPALVTPVKRSRGRE